MNRIDDHEDLIDLGAASVETKGASGIPEDTSQQLVQPAGLTDE